jgi:ABC-type Fe3+/spermidine/putrescine transport system ATPase subunit
MSVVDQTRVIEAAPSGHTAGAGCTENPPVSLEIDDLQVSYGAFLAIKGIKLSVARGEFIAILGPSGCGKTSLLRTIAGFVEPDRGSIVLNGRDVADLPPRARNIGLVFQSYALFPHMTALENVRFGLECRKVSSSLATERAEQALAMVGLSQLSDRRPRQLSGGQQQRVALARALVIEPDLLLLDEPLGALDKQLRVQMQTELKTLQKRAGITALFVTHDQEEAMSMADRIVVLRDGKIEQMAAPEELFTRPATAWIANFIGAGNLLRGKFRHESTGRLRIEVGPKSYFEVDAASKAGPDNAIFVPFDKVRLEPEEQGDGLVVTDRRYLGLMVEIQVAYDRGTICTQMPLNDAKRFDVGSRVRVTADRSDCRLLPDN